MIRVVDVEDISGPADDEDSPTVRRPWICLIGTVPSMDDVWDLARRYSGNTEMRDKIPSQHFDVRPVRTAREQEILHMEAHERNWGSARRRRPPLFGSLRILMIAAAAVCKTT